MASGVASTPTCALMWDAGATGGGLNLRQDNLCLFPTGLSEVFRVNGIVQSLSFLSLSLGLILVNEASWPGGRPESFCVFISLSSNGTSPGRQHSGVQDLRHTAVAGEGQLGEQVEPEC